ncbi:MAG: glycosyltransferase [Lachnospiraceae bacterium]|nr:glycosyltransferase [Lachnospiraceae bacterium]
MNEHLRLEKGIRRTVEYIRDHVDAERYPCRLTIVDNGSDDDTPEIGKRLEAEFPEVHYLGIRERGVGIAFRTGVEQSTADIVGYMDIDLSTDIRNLGKTIELFDARPEIDYVNASRFGSGAETTGRKWYRKITSRGLLFLLRTQLKMRSSDAIAGFTFLRREKALQLVRECYSDNGWFYMIEFLLRAERDGMRILDMPVDWTEDYDTTVHVWKTIRNYMKNIARLRRTFSEEDRQGKKH